MFLFDRKYSIYSKEKNIYILKYKILFAIKWEKKSRLV